MLLTNWQPIFTLPNNLWQLERSAFIFTVSYRQLRILFRNNYTKCSWLVSVFWNFPLLRDLRTLNFLCRRYFTLCTSSINTWSCAEHDRQDANESLVIFNRWVKLLSREGNKGVECLQNYVLQDPCNGGHYDRFRPEVCFMLHVANFR